MLRTLLIILSLLFVNLTNSFAEGNLSFLKENMPYMEARILLLENGWKPFSFGITDSEQMLPACFKRSGGSECTLENKDELCLSRIELCTSLPEYETCGARGYCMMIMENGEGKQLLVTVMGDISPINRKYLEVLGWDLQ